jgi:N-acetylmuramoyl-L-alanine amidase
MGADTAPDFASGPESPLGAQKTGPRPVDRGNLHVVKPAWLVIAGALLGLPPSTGAAPPAVDADAGEARPTGRVVVLDPGHGGSNSGTRGHGMLEKRLTLAIANQVADRLRAQGVHVELTRTSDRTLTLRQRIEVADRLPADLFVSIHANASPTRTQRGYETFVLTPRGVAVDGRALRADTRTHRPGVDAEIALVLDDVERGATQWESADLATRIQRALRERRGREGDRGVRQDAHHVLLGATMPAVLVEVGFLDHPVEGKELLQAETQAAIADALAEAILDQLAE